MTDVIELKSRPLRKVDGEKIVQAGIEIPGAAGGLHDAMQFAPVEFRRGDDIYIVMHLRCTKIRLEDAKGKDDDGEPVEGARRVGIFRPVKDETVLVSEDLVKEAVQANADLIRGFREEAAGIIRLDFQDTGTDGPADDDSD